MWSVDWASALAARWIPLPRSSERVLWPLSSRSLILRMYAERLFPEIRLNQLGFSRGGFRRT